jgi:hypothetical protein
MKSKKMKCITSTSIYDGKLTEMVGAGWGTGVGKGEMRRKTGKGKMKLKLGSGFSQVTLERPNKI